VAVTKAVSSNADDADAAELRHVAARRYNHHGKNSIQHICTRKEIQMNYPNRAFGMNGVRCAPDALKSPEREGALEIGTAAGANR
jgi:hypothetical protein